MNIFDLQAKISLDASELNTGIASAQTAMGNLSSGMSAGAVAVGNLVSGGISAAASAVVNFGKEAIQTGMDFEAGMSQVAATLGMTTDDIANNVGGAGDTFDALKTKASEMGRETIFSATEAAEGLNILAMSGFDAEQSIAMVEDVLHLAAAGSMDMASAAGYISGSMKGFADETKTSAYYADLMAKGATLANTSVSQLGEAMSAGAAGAAAYGQEADSMTISLLRLAEQGVVGSAAGTALAAAMKDLYTPTDQAAGALAELGIAAYDETGTARDFNDVVNELNGALSGMSDSEANAYKQTIFGIQGLNAFNKMTVTSIETQKTWAEALAGASEGMGEAAKQYSTMTDNLQGAKAGLESAFDGLKNAVYEKLTGPLQEAAKIGADALNAITAGFEEGGIKGALSSLATFAKDTLSGIWNNLKLPPEIQNIGSIFEGIAKSVQPLVDVLSDTLGGALADVASGFQEFLGSFTGEGIAGLTTVIDPVKQLFGVFVESLANVISSVAGAVKSFLNAFKDSTVISTLSMIGGEISIFLKSFTEQAAGIIKSISSAVSGFFDGFLQSDAVDAIAGVGEAVAGFLSVFVASLGSIISKVAEGVQDLLSAFDSEEAGRIIGDIAAGMAEFASAVMRVAGNVVQKIASAVGKLIDTFRESGAAESIGNVAAKIAEFVRPFTAGLANVIGLIGEKFGELIDWISDFSSSAIEDIPGVMDAIGGALDALGPMFDAIWDAIKPLVDWLGDVAMAQFEAFGILISGMWDVAVETVTFLFDLLKDLANFVTSVLTGDFEGAAKAIQSAWDGIGEFFSGVVDTIVGVFSGIKETFDGIGNDIVEGIKNGISNAWESFTSWITGKFDGLVSGVKKLLGIGSPSKVFAEIGKFTVEGMEVGWAEEFRRLEQTVADDMDSLSGTARIGFSDSAIGRSSAAGITSLMTANAGVSSSPVEINLMLDGDVAAKALYDPMKRVAWQKGRTEAVYA